MTVEDLIKELQLCAPHSKVFLRYARMDRVYVAELREVEITDPELLHAESMVGLTTKQRAERVVVALTNEGF